MAVTVLRDNTSILLSAKQKNKLLINSCLVITLILAYVFSHPPAAKASFLKAKSKPAEEKTKESKASKSSNAETNESQDSESDSEKTANSTESKDNSPYADEAIKHFNHGSELHQAGFLNQAIGEYKAAIAADNRVAEAYSNLGIIYATQHNYPKAKEAFQEALRLKPNRPTTLNGLGTVLYAEGQIPKAMDKWKEALAADPKFASAYYNMGNAFEEQKKYEEAKANYLKAIGVMPGMADAYFRLGNILSKEHHLPQAELLLSKSVELSPDSEFIREAKHSIAIIEGRFEKTRTKNTPPRKKQ